MSNKINPLFDTLQHHQSTEVSHLYANDLKIAGEFIYSYRGSQATFNAYRRELERLLQWSAHIKHKTLADINRHDIEEYLHFCQSPPNEWIGLKKCDRFINKNGQRTPNPNWRPFVVTTSKANHRSGKTLTQQDYTLSPTAMQSIVAIINSFYNYLIQEEVTQHNPMAQVRQKSRFIRKTQQRAPVRRLSELQWGYVIETAEKLAREDPLHERTLFIMSALYGMYLRVSELASSLRWQPSMNDFYSDQDNHWWFRTGGKGNKERHIAVSDAMLTALKRYRCSLNLPPLPDRNDHQPLILKNRGKGPITSTRHIRKIVQFCFDCAFTRMQNDGLEEDALQLKAATVHWLRHTGISDDVKHRPREHVRDDAGHGSSAITDRYIDVELRQRHASSRKKTIKPEEI